MSATMEMYEWIRYHKSKHLQIKDLEAWSVGEPRKVVLFDRNFEERGVWDMMECYTKYSPEKLFAGNVGVITFLGYKHYDKEDNKTGPMWKIDGLGETISVPIEIDVWRLGHGFTWFPLKGEFIHINQHVTFDYPHEELKQEGVFKKHGFERATGRTNMHWRRFPKNTRIGWRGPVMFYEDVINSPLDKVYWKDPQIDDDEIPI